MRGALNAPPSEGLSQSGGERAREPMTPDLQPDRIAALEAELADLKGDNARLRQRLDQRNAPGELRHRQRNTFAMLRMLIRSSAEPAEDLETYVLLLEDRLDAVARVQAAIDIPGRVDLAEIVGSRSGREPTRCRCAGRGWPAGAPDCPAHRRPHGSWCSGRRASFDRLRMRRPRPWASAPLRPCGLRLRADARARWSSRSSAIPDRLRGPSPKASGPARRARSSRRSAA